jgi:adenine-specific DNA-methyltransferase
MNREIRQIHEHGLTLINLPRTLARVNRMAKKPNYDDWSKEELIKELRRIKEMKYGLVWHRDLPVEKIIDAVIDIDARTPSEMFPNEMAGKPFPILKEVKNKEIETDKKKPTNLLIEGDNFHSLAVLNFTHHEAIDLIYIDPPYNTGSNDFIYNDKYVDDEDPYRHSKWLAFMERRLKLAKNLLKKDGVIFISIDDNEQAQLKLLCDEVFVEKNFVASIVWQRAYSPKNQSKRISIDHEYVLAYARDIDQLDFKLLPRTEKMDARYKNPDKDSRGKWKPGDLVANEERKNGHYIITGPNDDKFNAPSGKHWSYAQDKMMGLLKDNRLYFGKNGKAFPSLKQFLTEVQQGRKASTLFLHDEAGHNDEAKKEIKDFFEQSDDLFSTPKPTRLIKQLLRLQNNKDAVVLDFMAGSGTTGQAVINLNDEDGGNRQFILCTNNENKICTEICYPRIKKVIKGYKNQDGKDVEGFGGNLKYYACDFVEAEPTDQNKRKLVSESTEMLCIKENAFELVQDGSDFKIFKNMDKFVGLIFYEEAIDDFKKAIKKIKGHFNVYVFSLGDDAHEKAFNDVKGRVTLCAIPEVILKVYREIFK